MLEIGAMSDARTGLAEQHRAQARFWFEYLRDRICAEVEALAREAPVALFATE